MPLQLAVQRMTFPARPPHILNSNRFIQNIKLNRKPGRMLRLNPRLRSRLKELLYTLMPETLDHATIVYRNATLYTSIIAAEYDQSSIRDYNSPMLTHQRTLTTKTGAVAAGDLSVAALAFGAFALGAFALGALAIGALAIRKLVIGKGRVKDLHIDRLTIDHLDVQSTHPTTTR
jgi:hypothetical protein